MAVSGQRGSGAAETRALRQIDKKIAQLRGLVDTENVVAMLERERARVAGQLLDVRSVQLIRGGGA